MIGSRQNYLHILVSFLLVLFLLFFLSSSSFAKSGCCSWHGGVCNCNTNTGHQSCCDGTDSPSCTCEYNPPPQAPSPAPAQPSQTQQNQSTSNTGSGSGCCSYHGGICSCDTSVGKKKCCDGTLSPSCTCEYIPQTPTTQTVQLLSPSPSVKLKVKSSPKLSIKPSPSPSPSPSISPNPSLPPTPSLSPSTLVESSSPIIASPAVVQAKVENNKPLSFWERIFGRRKKRSFWSFLFGEKLEPSPSPSPSQPPSPSPEVKGVNIEPGDLVNVVKIVDGDTIDVSLSGQTKRVRLIGIDTPETVDPRKPVQCFGKEASNKMVELLTGRKVKLESDPTQGNLDKYQRLLRYVYRDDGIFINQYLIKTGYAHEYTYDIPYKFQSQFREAQDFAFKNDLGLWSPNACNK